MPSATSLMSAYASMTTSVLLVRSLANELIPTPVRTRIFSTLRFFFKPKSPNLTLLIEELAGIGRNQIYDASETYLRTKISPDADKLKISKTPKDKNLTIKLENDERVIDRFEGIELKWKFVCSETESKDTRNLQNFRYEKRWFELSFNKKYKEKVVDSYIPYVLERAKAIQNELRVLKMFTLNNAMVSYGGIKWDSIKFEHPATFETLAMEPEIKNAVMEDLNMFLKRKDFYKRVGRAWKRGYLLYGPPGTGKSSLVAAMANYLRFDVYDLQLANVISDSDLRRLLLATGNKSILVIEDIDCSLEFPDRRVGVADGTKKQDLQLTLSGLLNFIDGLWSSCGDERIIIFTTNNKDRLDPALLRPGRMDMHINMSYCKPSGFRILASNYLGISGNHRLVSEIEGLMDHVEVTPAQVAEELMRSEHVDVALEGLLKLLKRKHLEGTTDQMDENKAETQMNPKKQKIENNVYS